MPKSTSTPINTVSNMKNYLSEEEYKKDIENAKRILSDAPLEKIMIPKQMANVLGQILPVMINGVQVRIPVDGETHEIPAPFAAIARQSLKVVQTEDVREEVSEQMDLKGAPE